MLGGSCVCVAAGRCLNLRPARWPGRDRWATARRLYPYRREEEATGTAHTTRADAKTRASLTAATTRRDTLTKPRRAPFLGHTRYPAGIHPPGTLVQCSAPNRVQRSVPRARQHVWRARVQHLTRRAEKGRGRHLPRPFAEAAAGRDPACGVCAAVAAGGGRGSGARRGCRVRPRSCVACARYAHT